MKHLLSFIAAFAALSAFAQENSWPLISSELNTGNPTNVLVYQISANPSNPAAIPVVLTGTYVLQGENQITGSSLTAPDWSSPWAELVTMDFVATWSINTTLLPGHTLKHYIQYDEEIGDVEFRRLRVPGPGIESAIRTRHWKTFSHQWSSITPPTPGGPGGGGG